MLRSLLLALCLASLSTLTYAQGTVRGVVSDATGETIIGASVTVKEKPGVFATTDLDGKYSIKLPDSDEVTLLVSFVALKTSELKVRATNGEVVIRNVELDEEKELAAVVVERKALRRSDSHLERLKVNSAASIDYISADAMLKTGDGDASAAVKRVTGVSTAGSFVTVRGLADRYIVTTINGSRIPTLDPFTNNLKLDLFPTGLLDNIVITKTATPDLPGDWAGALVSLNTSDYPEKLRVSVSTTVGYNPNSTFKDVVIGARSSTDWLGKDDGLRGIPNGVPANIEDFPVFQEPDLYQQLVLLGLGNTLAGYGIVSSTPGFQTTTMPANVTSQLAHLPLVNLGLLAPALINDPNAVQGAVDTYNSTYNLAYFSPTVNGELASLNTRFNNSNWRLKQVKANPNFNQTFSIGNQLDIFKKGRTQRTLGFLLGMRYSSDTRYDGASTQERTGAARNDPAPGSVFDLKADQQVTTETNGWNALGSLSLKLNRNNSFSVLVMPNVLGQNNARYQVFKKPSINGETFASEDQFYEERKLWVYQYGSKHFFPGMRLRVEADASYSDGNRNILDLKRVQYTLPPPGQPIEDVDGALEPPARIYRFLDETLFDSRIGFELPLSSDERSPDKFKFGGGYRNDTRKNQQSYFTILGAPGPTQWEQPGRFDLQPDGRFISQYFPFGSFKDNDIGISKVYSAYMMADLSLTRRLRVVGGLRGEHTDLTTDILRYHEEGLDPEDPSRGTVGDVAVAGGLSSEPKPAVPGLIDQWDILPSVNFIYKLKEDEFAPMNLRLNYFRSLGRPSFREFSVVQLFDFIYNAPVFGNPDLKMTTVDNFDVRVERFFQNRNNISLSGFYKQFENHIELVSTLAGGFTWRNANRSQVYGMELEGRVGLTRNIEWRGNLTLMRSESELSFNITGEEVKYTTPMFGQAPYIVNSMFTWSADSVRFSASVSYNVQGPKLVVANSEVAPDAVAAYEMPRHLIDITLNKSIGTHWGVKLRARNLLNAPQRRAYKFDSGYDVDFDKYTYGADYQLTLSYSIK